MALLTALSVASVSGNIPLSAHITIAQPGTTNATLLYDGAPMFKVGPLPEQAPFALKLGDNPTFDHIQWFEWMKSNRLEYGRVYPDNGAPRLHGVAGGVPADAPGRVFPFEIAHWQDGRPIADLTRFDPAYWENMSRVIREAARRDIVLQLQLYQRAYFARRDNGWEDNFFNPVNNINAYPVTDAARGGATSSGVDAPGSAYTGYHVIRAMAEDTPWRDIHRAWVEHILHAVGDSGNVIIDLMNEGSFNEGISREWIDFTLDVIEDWERATDRQILVGMDFDHLYKQFRRSGDRSELDYVLGHPRLDVLIAEGSEGHIVPGLAAGARKSAEADLAREFRVRYRKPIVSTNSPSYGPDRGAEEMHLYQWYALLTKTQGGGAYCKRFPLDFDAAPVSEYADRSGILMRFFDGLEDYAALAPVADDRLQAPGDYSLALDSAREAVVYLHAGIGKDPIVSGTMIRLNGLAIRDGTVTIDALDPRSGQVRHWQASVVESTLTMQTPFEAMDMALHVQPRGKE